MEILAYSNCAGGFAANFGGKSVYKGSESCQSKVPAHDKSRILCAVSDSRKKSLRAFKGNKFLSNPDHGGGFDSVNAYRISKRASLKVQSAKYDGYVAGVEEHLEDISEIGESVGKVLIPGLPDDSTGEHATPISSSFWEWKPKLFVHYEKAGSKNVKSPPVLFLPGFGVGSFHYEKQLKDLGRDYRVWAIDFLGQGMSLPTENPTVLLKEGDSDSRNFLWGFGDETEPWANNLVYSSDLWQDQVRNFVEEVIGEPVYVVGNSLGGFVALCFAANNPQLVKGITLLNATPFWGFLPNPLKSPRLAKIIPWSGTFPLSSGVKKFTKLLWQKISDPRTIADILRQVYADHSTNVDKVFSRIVEITQHPAAAASFASIMLAPQGQLSFKESLSMCNTSNIPICFVYGKEDPWVRPFWGLLAKGQVPDAPFYEISPAGHCPHDEVPEVVNYLLRGFMKTVESGGLVTLPLLDYTENTETSIIRKLEFVREGSNKSVSVMFYGSRFMIWDRIYSLIRSQFRRVETIA